VAILRRSLRRPRTWLLVLATVMLLGVLDSFRQPSDQVTARLYVGLVRLYQGVGRPMLRDIVQCRYHPSCSDYSAEAVQTHGIRRGLVLTLRRIGSCTAAVPPGTHDPVPPAGAAE
jgi:putative membrane protein insertion efficiency factor